MAESEKLSLEQIRALLEGTEEVQFQARDRAERYAWVERVLRQQDYPRLGRAGKELVRRYLAKMTGLSRAQVTRLIGRYEQGQPVTPPPPRWHRFATRYTKEDILLRIGLAAIRRNSGWKISASSLAARLSPARKAAINWLTRPRTSSSTMFFGIVIHGIEGVGEPVERRHGGEGRRHRQGAGVIPP